MPGASRVEGSVSRGIVASRAGPKKNGIEIRSSPRSGEITRCTVALR